MASRAAAILFGSNKITDFVCAILMFIVFLFFFAKVKMFSPGREAKICWLGLT